MQGSGLPEACVLRLAWASETPQAMVGRGALVWTLDDAWKKLRQVVPARVGLQVVSAHSSLEVGAPDQVTASIYWMPNTTFCVPWL